MQIKIAVRMFIGTSFAVWNRPPKQKLVFPGKYCQFFPRSSCFCFWCFSFDSPDPWLDESSRGSGGVPFTPFAWFTFILPESVCKGDTDVTDCAVWPVGDNDLPDCPYPPRSSLNLCCLSWCAIGSFIDSPKIGGPPGDCAAWANPRILFCSASSSSVTFPLCACNFAELIGL